MSCEKCGAETPENVVVCSACENPAIENPAVENLAVENLPVTEIEVEATPKKGGGKKKIIIGLVAAAVVATGAFAATKMMEKDPKQTVIAAFESVYSEDQVSPTEEIFGWSQFASLVGETDLEYGMSMKLDKISESNLSMLENSGFRVIGKDDNTNKRNMGSTTFTYGGMDFMNVNAYVGEETLMMSVPELTQKVFTLDLSDGLLDRIKQSETVGPLLEETGMDIDAFAAYVEELQAQADSEEGYAGLDMKALYQRYQDGCKAQDDLKAAMTVTKASQGQYLVDGKEEKCQGYDVLISKESMIAFLRNSSDFFLADETFREQYLKQLEQSVKMSEIFGAASFNGYGSVDAENMQEQMKEAVNEMITYLDQSLTDIQMTVFVSKNGHLAATTGSTIVKNEDSTQGDIRVLMHAELQGGAYRTQNIVGTIGMEAASDATKIGTVTIDKKGVYDNKQLTSDLAIGVVVEESASKMDVTYTSTYASETGVYHMAGDVVSDGSKVMELSADGTVDELEKGKTIHASVDELKITIMEDQYVLLSGDFFFRPLSGEVKALEGAPLDVLKATTNDWQEVIMEAYDGIIKISSQLGI